MLFDQLSDHITIEGGKGFKGGRMLNTKHQVPFDQLSDYTTIGGKLGFKEDKTADWSASIAPFWPAVWRTALSWKGVKNMLRP
jgi:hypothetical protein